MQIKSVPYQAADGTRTTNRFWSYGKTSDLLVILPGRSYTLDNALLHHLSGLAAWGRMDVFGVQYPFHASKTSFEMANVPALVEDVRGVLAAFLQERSYQRTVIAGKSLGTALISQVSGELPGIAGHILFTPVPGGLVGTETTPSLAVIGTKDPFYSALADDIATPPAGVRWKVYDGLDHALEAPGNWESSIEALRETLSACEQFLGDVL